MRCIASTKDLERSTKSSSTFVNTGGRTSSSSSILSLVNSIQMKQCMTIRTQRESLDATACEKSKGLAKIRLRRRLIMRGEKHPISQENIVSTTADGDDSGDGDARKDGDEGAEEGSCSQSNQSDYNTSRPVTIGFNHVDIRNYPIVLGDNPSVSKGAPISIDWEHFGECCFDVDKYEKVRKDERRTKAQMRIPHDVRYDILEMAGELDEDVDGVVKEIENIKSMRDKVARQSDWQARIDAAKEKANRGLKNVFRAGKKKKEKDFLKRSMDQACAERRKSDKVALQVDAATLALSVL